MGPICCRTPVGYRLVIFCIWTYNKTELTVNFYISAGGLFVSLELDPMSFRKTLTRAWEERMVMPGVVSTLHPNEWLDGILRCLRLYA